MSSHRSPRWSSWFRKLAGPLSVERTRTTPKARHRGRPLGFEPLEHRAMLSADILPSIAGTVFHDMKLDGLTSDDVRLSGVTVKLYRDGGNGTLESSADQLIGTTTTDGNGKYHFDNLTAGTYFVQQIATSGVVIPAGQDVAKLTISASDVSGTSGTAIDTFSTTPQYVTGAMFRGSYSGVAMPATGGRTGSSTVSATEAIGGYRDLYVQLTSTNGSVALGANANIPNTLEFAAASASNGIYTVTWDGQSSDPQNLNATGLGQIDLTNQGANTGIKLTLGADHDNCFADLKIYSSATSWSWAHIAIPNTDDGTANQEVFVPWSAFQGGSGATAADFTKVGAIQLNISGVNAADGQVGPIFAAGPKVLSQNFVNVSQTDLEIVKQFSPSTAVAGQALTYTMTVTNHGPSDATNVKVSDTLPVGVTFVEAHSSIGSVNCVDGVITANLGNLANGASATTVVTVTVLSKTVNSLTNTGTVTGYETDPNLSNNTSTVVTPVTASVDLVIEKSGLPEHVKAGHQLTYTLKARNDGPSDATDVVVTDTLPPGVTYVSSSLPNATSYANGKVTINLGKLAGKASAADTTIVVNVDEATTGTLQNKAEITSATREPLPPKPPPE